MKDALYGCYLRVGDPGPWAGPWAGIARLEMPSGIGRAAAVEAAERAAGWLPVFASALHRDARAPVNLTPIAGLERPLHRLRGTHALPYVRCARQCSNATAKDGRHDRRRGDASGSSRRWARAGGPTARRVATPGVEPRRRDRREPFEHDSRTASGAAGRPAGGSPGVRPRMRRSPPGSLTQLVQLVDGLGPAPARARPAPPTRPPPCHTSEHRTR